MAGIRSRKTHAGLAAGIAASLLVAAAQGSHAADADDVTTIFVSDGQELADALRDSASSSKPVVITLLNDVSVEQPYSYVYGGSADLTIDGDDHMLTFDDASISISSSADPISVTIKDVTLVDVASPDSAVEGDDRFVSISSVGSVLVKNVTAQDSVLDGAALSIRHSGDVHIDGLTLTSIRLPGAANVSPLYLENVTNAVIENSHFETSSTASSRGGAFYAQVASAGTLIIRDSVFIANSSPNWTGGALHSANANPVVIERSQFEGNSARYGGGAVSANGPAHAFDSVFALNRTTVQGTGQSGAGGAVLAQGFVTERSVYAYNEAAGEGGAVWTSGDGAEAEAWIVSSTFASNTARGEGGGILIWSQPTAVVSSTFIENSASYGSHIQAYFAEVATSASVYAHGVSTGTDLSCNAGTVSHGYNFDDTGNCAASWSHATDFGQDGGDPMLGEFEFVTLAPPPGLPSPAAR